MTCRHRLIARLIGILTACCPAIGHGQADPGTLAAASAAGTGILPRQDESAGTGDSEGLPGRATIQLRPRYTYVKQSNKPEKAEAGNVRLLLGYRTAPIGDFAYTAQLVSVDWLEPKRAANQPGSFASRYPLVSDPDKTDVNLLHADYLGLPDLRFRLGRQEIKLDNERFVGAADVRQMPQVFDAISLRSTGIPDTTLYAAHAWHVRTSFGNRFQTRTTLLNARYQQGSGLSAGAYAYFQDQPKNNNRTGFADNSNRIAGVRVEGNTPASNRLSWYYTAEIARQQPYAAGDQRIRATYGRLAFGPSWNAYSAQINYERLGSNQGQYGFQMPLSYNTFQGGASSFFSTPAEGVRDLNASIAARFGRLDLALKHHRFKADFGGARQGREWDFSVGYPISESITVRAIFAQFRADSASVRPSGARAVFGQSPTPSADRYYVTLQYDY